MRGPRFTLTASEIHACYPVPGSAGTYSQLLPHITLDAPALPWARLLSARPAGPEASRGWRCCCSARASCPKTRRRWAR